MEHKNKTKIYFKIPFLTICIITVFAIQTVCATDSLSRVGEYITINPIGDHFIGDNFTLNGSVNISEAKQLAIQIEALNVRAKIETGRIAGEVTTIDFQNNIWSYTLNTTNWIPDKYAIYVFPDDKNTTWTADALFSLSERPSMALPITLNSPISIITTIPSKQPTMQKTPLATMIPIIAIGILIFFIIFNKK
jgi:trimeric autotransporter adhesin